MTTRRKYMLEFPCLFFPCFSSHCRGASEGWSTRSGRGALSFVQARVLLGWCPVTLTACYRPFSLPSLSRDRREGNRFKTRAKLICELEQVFTTSPFSCPPSRCFPNPGSTACPRRIMELWKWEGPLDILSPSPFTFIFYFCIKILSVEFNSQIAV